MHWRPDPDRRSNHDAKGTTKRRPGSIHDREMPHGSRDITLSGCTTVKAESRTNAEIFAAHTSDLDAASGLRACAEAF
jgi:hypothetical protein